MLGRKLAESLVADPIAPLERLTLVDAFVAPTPPAGATMPVDCVTADITDPAAVRALNETVLRMHAAKLTRSQMVMFTFADMMTIAEVGAAFVAQAAAAPVEGLSHEATLAMSRAFARKAARVVRQGAELCAGCLLAEPGDEAAAAGHELLATTGGLLPAAATGGLWEDMNTVGAALKALD